jgi:hypothetical protein
MRRVVIDDLRMVKEELYSDWQDSGEVHVIRNSSEALSFLDANTVHVDELYLDHDLGIVDGQEDTIMPVVDYLCEKAFNDTPVSIGTIYVHTSNPVGGNQMKKSLERYGYRVVRIHSDEVFRYII